VLLDHDQLRKRTGKRAACVNREWRGLVETAKELGMYKRNLLSVVAGDSIDLTEGRSLYLGFGASGGLGHGGKEHEFVPRLVEALAGKKMVGASAGNACKAAWTTAGEFFTLYEKNGTLGHGA